MTITPLVPWIRIVKKVNVSGVILKQENVSRERHITIPSTTHMPPVSAPVRDVCMPRWKTGAVPQINMIQQDIVVRLLNHGVPIHLLAGQPGNVMNVETTDKVRPVALHRFVVQRRTVIGPGHCVVLPQMTERI